MAGYDLPWYTDIAGRTINDIYWQELNRAPDWLGACNWLYWLREKGWTEAQIRAEIRKSDEWHAIHDPKPIPSLPRLVNRNGFFAKENGERFTVIGCSDFNLLCSYLVHGEAYTRSIMQERASIGFNWLRVWTAYWDTNTGQGIPGIGELNPAKEPGVYAAMQPFCALAAEYGLYIEFTAFTGPHINGHWEQIGVALQGVTNCVVELCNENDAHAVRIDPAAYSPLSSVLCSHGSNGSQAVPPRPAWGYEILHNVNVSEWHRKTGHNTMELTTGAEGLPASHVPAIGGENTRPDQDGNLQHFYDAAAAAALLCAGSTFHSNSGKASFLFSALDRRFAQAWVEGCKSVPLEFQDGRYIREAPGDDLRVYSRQLPDGRKHTVPIAK